MTKLFYLHSVALQKTAYEETNTVIKLLGKDKVSTQVYDIPSESVVVPRYRAIPFGVELENEVLHSGSKLINSYHEHRNIANLWNWVGDLSSQNLTAPAYSVDDIKDLPDGEWFVKGETNSLKNNWFSACYAPNTSKLIDIIGTNWNDSVIGSQSIVIRPFQNFRKIGEDVTGRPIFNERRCFVYGTTLLSYANYWSSFPEFVTDAINEDNFKNTLDTAIVATEKYAPFRVIDLAEYPDGTWSIVELNDGSMSGLSDNDPAVVWGNLKSLLS